MNGIHNKKLTNISKILRIRMTKEEKHLWYDFLKQLPFTIHRQKIIGSYIVDFYCAAAKLVIEIDGSQHHSQKGRQDDARRDSFLNEMGITVLRYSNLDIHQNFDGVCSDILHHLPLFFDD